MSFENTNDDWNDDIAEDLKPNLKELEGITIGSRDWTVETVITQIQKGNIELNPKFQRRNAWDDIKRSRLIESLILGMPVPEIVLAEDPNRKGSFFVIDGKQRLTSIIGFVESENSKFQYWNDAELQGLKTREDLNGLTYPVLSSEPKYENEHRRFTNQGIRSTLITNYKSQDVLYDIFYRLNTGSVPLSTQELRQVLNKGDFADYLIEITNSNQPIHEVMGLEKPDNRLRDIEIILRFISIVLFGDKYKSNLKKFLDDSMQEINNDWDEFKPKVEAVYSDFNKAITLLSTIIETEKIGRKFTKGRWEGKFNKVLFEVEVYYFMELIKYKISSKEKKEFIQGFQELCESDTEFRRSIELSTKDIGQYEVRFKRFLSLINKVFHKKISNIPITLKT